MKKNIRFWRHFSKHCGCLVVVLSFIFLLFLSTNVSAEKRSVTETKYFEISPQMAGKVNQLDVLELRLTKDDVLKYNLSSTNATINITFNIINEYNYNKLKNNENDVTYEVNRTNNQISGIYNIFSQDKYYLFVIVDLSNNTNIKKETIQITYSLEYKVIEDFKGFVLLVLGVVWLIFLVIIYRPKIFFKIARIKISNPIKSILVSLGFISIILLIIDEFNLLIYRDLGLRGFFISDIIMALTINSTFHRKSRSAYV